MEHYFTNSENLKSEIREINYEINSIPFLFYSDLGVFSKDKIDTGSNILVSTYLTYHTESKRILDIGCGYGFIGIVLSKITNSFVTLTDINKRALHLTSRNIVKNDVKCEAFVSDAYKEINDIYDIIITNPPIRAGKEKVLEILNNARFSLKDDGELWYVIRKNQGAKSITAELEKNYTVNLVSKSKGFYVYKAKKLKN